MLVFKIFKSLKCILKSFDNVSLKVFHSKTHVPESVFNKFATLKPETLLKKDCGTSVSREFLEVLKSTFLTEHL